MSDNNMPVVATKRISYGPEAADQIMPDTVFAPADHGLDIEELRRLGAVADCTEADEALHAKQQEAKAPAEAPKKEAPKAPAKPAEPDIG